MKVTCEQLEGILERQDAAELAALEEHARACEGCALQLRLEREISAAAPGLRREWESAGLWNRIEQALGAEGKSQRVYLFPRAVSARWRLAAAAAVLLVVTATAVRIAFQPPEVTENIPTQLVIDEKHRLLNEQTLAQVEKAESAYKESIEKLAALAEPKLKQADSALLSSYREKLIVLDAAIHDIRIQAEGNRFNAHLRKELLEVYQAKQQTLKQLVQEDVR